MYLIKGPKFLDTVDLLYDLLWEYNIHIAAEFALFSKHEQKQIAHLVMSNASVRDWQEANPNDLIRTYLEIKKAIQ